MSKEAVPSLTIQVVAISWLGYSAWRLSGAARRQAVMTASGELPMHGPLVPRIRGDERITPVSAGDP